MNNTSTCDYLDVAFYSTGANEDIDSFNDFLENCVSSVKEVFYVFERFSMYCWHYSAIGMLSDEYMRKIGYEYDSLCLMSELIRKNADVLDWYDMVVSHCVTESIALEFKDRIDLNLFLQHNQVSEQFLDALKDEIDWKIVCGEQRLSYEFMMSHAEYCYPYDNELLLYNVKTNNYDVYRFYREFNHHA